MRVNANAYRSLRRNLRAVQQSSTRKIALKDIFQDANGLYLEYNFGFLPLLSLFKDAASLLGERFDQHVPRVKMSGKEFFSDVVSSKIQPFVYSPLSTTLGSFSQVTTQTYKYTVWHGGLLISTVERESLQSQLGLKLGNIPLSIWELVRASFVVDYFINIGDVLSNLKDSSASLQPASMYKSTKWEYDCEIFVDGHKPPVNPVSGVTKYHGSTFEILASGKTHYMNFSRIPVGGSAFILPLRVQPQSWDHIVKTLSVAASMTGVFRR